MENKPNLKNNEMIINNVSAKDYRNANPGKCPKKQTQFKPKQTQFRQTRRSLHVLRSFSEGEGEGGQTQNTCRVEALAKTGLSRRSPGEDGKPNLRPREDLAFNQNQPLLSSASTIQYLKGKTSG
jgi:hypothetical protein